MGHRRHTGLRARRADRSPIRQLAGWLVGDGVAVAIAQAQSRIALAPGTYRFVTNSLQLMALDRRFVVREGETTQVHITVPSARVRPLAFHMMPGPDLASVRATITDDAGKQVLEGGVDHALDGHCYIAITLATGRYVLGLQRGRTTLRATFDVDANTDDVALAENRFDVRTSSGIPVR